MHSPFYPSLSPGGKKWPALWKYKLLFLIKKFKNIDIISGIHPFPNLCPPPPTPVSPFLGLQQTIAHVLGICIYVLLLISSLFLFSHSHSSPLTNKSARNIHIQVTIHIYVFVFLSHDKEWERERPIHNLGVHLIFYETNYLESSSTILYSHQQYMKVPVIPNPHQYSVCLFYFILLKLKWNECVGISNYNLICISLIINDIEYLFIWLFDISISFFVKCSNLLPNWHWMFYLIIKL